MEEKKKKNNRGIIILIIVLVMIILGLSGYILVDKDIIKLKKEEVKTEENKVKKEINEEEIDVNDQTAINLLNKSLEIDDYKIFKAHYSIFDIIYKDGFDINNMTTDELDPLVSKYIKNKINGNVTEKDGKEIICDYSADDEDCDGVFKISKSTFGKYAEEYFGKDYKFVEPTETDNYVYDKCGTYYYYKETDLYTSSNRCGGAYVDTHMLKITKIVKNKNIYTYRVKQAYLDGTLEFGTNVFSNGTLIRQEYKSSSEEEAYKEIFDESNTSLFEFDITIDDSLENFKIKSLNLVK